MSGNFEQEQEKTGRAANKAIKGVETPCCKLQIFGGETVSNALIYLVMTVQVSTLTISETVGKGQKIIHLGATAS